MRGTILQVAGVALAMLVAASSFAQAPPADIRSLVPGGGALTLYVDAGPIHQSRTFLRVMDVIERSTAYLAVADRIAAWGFRPRSDLHELLVVFDDLDPEGDFVAVARGAIQSDRLREQLGERERLTPQSDDHGEYWASGRLVCVVGDGFAIAGTGALVESARHALTAPAAPQGPRPDGTIWLDAAPSAADRARTPALRDVERITVSLFISDAPSLQLHAVLATDDAARAAADELNQALRLTATVPEVMAIGLGPLLSSSTATAEGRDVTLHAQLDAASWARFSDVIEQLVAEELR